MIFWVFLSPPVLKFTPSGGSGETRLRTSGILPLFFSRCFLCSSQCRGHLPVSSNSLYIFSLPALQQWLNALLLSVQRAFKNEEYFFFLNIPRLLRLSKDSRKPSFRLNDPFISGSIILPVEENHRKSFTTIGLYRN